MMSGWFKIAAGLGGAFVAAVLVAVVMTCGYAGVGVLMSGGGTDVGSGLMFIAVNAAYVSAIIALPAILILALPHIVVSNRLRRTSRMYYLASGMVIGLVAILVAGIRQRMLPAPPLKMGLDEYFYLLAAAVAGAISALTFWKVARPDRRS